MKTVYKLLLTFNSIMLMIIVYLVKESVWILCLGKYTIILYLLVPVVLAGFSLLVSEKLSHDSIEGGVQNVEMANDSYMPSYLGYFFVALSIPIGDWTVLTVVFGILFVFTYFSQSLYYNPLFLLFGYRFYYVTKKNNLKVFIISKKDIRETKDLRFDNLRRINDFTFIDKERA